MAESRSKKAKLNILTSLAGQAVKLICGLIVPRLLIRSFGSEVYGATSSIVQFLAYITLLEGGIGGVARAALYKPLAENNMLAISKVQSEVQRFFRIVGYVFVAYVLVIACSFKSISGTEAIDWVTSFLLVLAISLSTFGQYFFGISNAVLLQAAQKVYVTQILLAVTTVINTISIVVLVSLKCDIVTVKLISSLIFLLRPMYLWLYVRKNYALVKVKKSEETYIKQKWSGMGQHLAYYLHSNTDIAVLTIFANLKSVAVYSVYNMVVSNIQNFTSSFSTGMEALFGDMLAKEEHEKLQKTFSYYETLISVIAVILFATTAVLIVPFIRIYTDGVTDADYIQPVFAILLIVSAMLYCLRSPYHSVVIAAGHFRQTNWAAYGEAILNVGLSLLLVHKYDYCGVIFATVVATVFRLTYYVAYLSRNLIHRSIWLFVKRTCVNAGAFLAIWGIGSLAVSALEMSSYLRWMVGGVIVVSIAAVITLTLNGIVYRQDFTQILKKFTKKK